MSEAFFRRSFVVLALFALSGGAAFAAPSARIHISNNWAGYAATGDTYSGVSATWTVPTSTGTDQVISADAAWVGIGGISDNDLIQAGTQAVILNGRTQYVAWYELLPGTQQVAPIDVHPGDLVSVSVNEVSKGYWSIVINNQTTQRMYQNVVAYHSSRSSAEWIVERPLAVAGNAMGYLPLSNFGSTLFKQATLRTTHGQVLNAADSGAQALIMGGEQSRLLAAPGDTTGDSFMVSYLSDSESRQYMQDLRRDYTLQRQENVASREANYQQINTSFIIHVIFSGLSKHY